MIRETCGDETIRPITEKDENCIRGGEMEKVGQVRDVLDNMHEGFVCGKVFLGSCYSYRLHLLRVKTRVCSYKLYTTPF